MKLNEKLVTELRATLTEIDDPLAVVVFVISETDDDTESQVKVIANIPTGAAAEVQQLINGAMDEVVASRDEPEEELPFDDKLALSLCDTFVDGLSDHQQALWDFNEDAIELCDAFVDANLCRKELHDWYEPFRSFLDSEPFDVTPALTRLADRGRTTESQEVASMWTVAVCCFTPIDHRDPPAEISEGIEEMATHHIAWFFKTIRDKAGAH